MESVGPGFCHDSGVHRCQNERFATWTFGVRKSSSASISMSRRPRRATSPTIVASAAALPTLNDVLSRGGSLILVSHLGRPSGDPAADAPFRMDPVAARLAEVDWPCPSRRPTTPSGRGLRQLAHELAPGEIVVLENVRFNKGEKKGDPAFAKQMAGPGGRLCQ